MQPKTAEHWRNQGYRLSPIQSKCPACGDAVDVWAREQKKLFGRPGSQVVLVNPHDFEPHWSRCREAKTFRSEQRREAGAL
jgi:hypothetical protein